MGTNPSTLPLGYACTDQGPKFGTVTIVPVVFAMAVLAVCLRFLARILTKAHLWYDDYVILVALVCPSLRISQYLLSDVFLSGCSLWGPFAAVKHENKYHRDPSRSGDLKPPHVR